MRDVPPLPLDAVPPDEAVRAICSRFPWARKYRPLLAEAVEWQQDATPRPNFYFRWHLPRLVATLDVLGQVTNSTEVHSVLDLACFPPFSVLMERWIGRRSDNQVWSRTSYTGGPESFQVSGKTCDVPTTAANLNTSTLPFDSAKFDIVLFMETIEHVHRHPQYVLCEINRVLRTGGLLLVTTPNVASWKKIKGLTDGNWGFDSPTFGADWGHRYEFSPYQMQEMLRASGYAPVREVFRDVYFDDPRGIIQAAQFWILLGAKVLTGEVRQATKLGLRSGSGMFLAWRKVRDAEPRLSDFVSI